MQYGTQTHGKHLMRKKCNIIIEILLVLPVTYSSKHKIPAIICVLDPATCLTSVIILTSQDGHIVRVGFGPTGISVTK